MPLNERTSTTDAVESVVIADLGRASSSAALLELVGGAFRFVARAEGPSTADAPYSDLTVGWHRVLGQLEWEAGRRLSERDGLLMPQRKRGDGVDQLIVCATAAEPIRVAVIEAGPSDVTSSILDDLRRANARLFHTVVHTRGKESAWVTVQAAALRKFRADILIIVAGGKDGAVVDRAVQLVRQTTTVSSVSALQPTGKPQGVSRAFIIASNAHQSQFSAVFGSKSNVTMVAPGDKPSAEIAAEIQRDVFDRYRDQMQSPDFADVTRDSSGEPVVRAQAVDLVTRYIARAFGRRVLTIGVEDGTDVHWAAGEQSFVSTLPQLDMSASIGGLTSQEVLDAMRWLPFVISDDDLMEWVLNRLIRPWTTPAASRDLLIEQALTRQVARRAIAEISRAQPLALSGADLVIGSRWFARGNQPGAAALALLDSVDVVPNHGVVDLAIDQDGLMALAGALGVTNPRLAADVFEYDGLIHLGSAVVIGGTTHDGDLACRGEIQYENGESTSFSVASGSLEVLPLRPGDKASLVMRPERRFSVGGNPSGKSVNLTGDRRLIGGAVGVIIDARGRSLATGPPARATKVKQWFDAVNGGASVATRRNT